AQGGTTIPPVHEPRRDNDADFSVRMLQYFANDFFEVAGTFYGGRAGSTGPERKVTEQVSVAITGAQGICRVVRAVQTFNRINNWIAFSILDRFTCSLYQHFVKQIGLLILMYREVVFLDVFADIGVIQFFKRLVLFFGATHQ